MTAKLDPVKALDSVPNCHYNATLAVWISRRKRLNLSNSERKLNSTQIIWKIKYKLLFQLKLVIKVDGELNLCTIMFNRRKATAQKFPPSFRWSFSASYRP